MGAVHAVHSRHFNVQEHAVVEALLHEHQRLMPVGGFICCVASPLKESTQHATGNLRIVHHKDSASGPRLVAEEEGVVGMLPHHAEGLGVHVVREEALQLLPNSWGGRNNLRWRCSVDDAVLVTGSFLPTSGDLLEVPCANHCGGVFSLKDLGSSAVWTWLLETRDSPEPELLRQLQEFQLVEGHALDEVREAESEESGWCRGHGVGASIHRQAVGAGSHKHAGKAFRCNAVPLMGDHSVGGCTGD
mmetsp:Transcript_29809/g.86811  ORF Transcript_29809/g.86811 Transcript_29809/m.86811 type:complete len:246 (-) Transcript_29809:949-1686(-)